MAGFPKVSRGVWWLAAAGVGLFLAGTFVALGLPKPGSQAAGGVLRIVGLVSLLVSVLDVWLIGTRGATTGFPRRRGWAVALALLTHSGGLIYARRYAWAGLVLAVEMAACAVWQVSLKERLAADTGYGFESALFLWFELGAAVACAVLCWKSTRAAPVAPGASLSPSSG